MKYLMIMIYALTLLAGSAFLFGCASGDNSGERKQNKQDNPAAAQSVQSSPAASNRSARPKHISRRSSPEDVVGNLLIMFGTGDFEKTHDLLSERVKRMYQLRKEWGDLWTRVAKSAKNKSRPFRVLYGRAKIDSARVNGATARVLLHDGYGKSASIKLVKKRYGWRIDQDTFLDIQ